MSIDYIYSRLLVFLVQGCLRQIGTSIINWIYPIPPLTKALYLKGKQCYDVFTSHSAFVSLQAAAPLSRLGKWNLELTFISPTTGGWYISIQTYFFETATTAGQHKSFFLIANTEKLQTILLKLMFFFLWGPSIKSTYTIVSLRFTPNFFGLKKV